MEGAFKNQIVAAVEPVFLSPILGQLTEFGQVTALTMLQHLLSSYEAIDQIDLEKNSVKMMGPYNPAEPLSWLVKRLETGVEFAQAGGKKIDDAMMVSKGITPVAQMTSFNEDI